MKKTIPQNKLAKFRYYLSQYKWQILVVMFVFWILGRLNTISRQFLNSRQEYEYILVFDKDYQSGNSVDLSDLKTKKIDIDSFPNGAYSKDQVKDLKDSRIAVDVLEGEIVTRNVLLQGGQDNKGLLSHIDDDQKIYTLSIEDVHILPQLNQGDIVGIFSYDKENKIVTNPVVEAKVIRVFRAEMDGGGQVASAIAMGLNDQEIKELTRSLANNWYLELVVRK